jgi:hypothetical protein
MNVIDMESDVPLTAWNCKQLRRDFCQRLLEGPELIECGQNALLRSTAPCHWKPTKVLVHVRFYMQGWARHVVQSVYTKAVSRDISGAKRRMGEGNENLVYPSLWDFKRSLTCRKILLPIRRTVCWGFLSPFKNPLRRRGSNQDQWQAH